MRSGSVVLAVAVAAVALARPSRTVALPTVPPSPALPTSLDLPTALRILRERGLDLLTAEAAIASAEGEVRVAGAVPNPSLSAGYGESFNLGACRDAGGNPIACSSYPATYTASLSDGAAISDSVSGKRGLRLDVAHRALAAARASRDDALRNVEAQVKQQFVQVLTARESLSFSREVAAAQARTLDLTRARYQEGAISEADLARIETAKLEADQQVDQARAAFRNAQVALAFLLGVRGPVPPFDVVGGELATSKLPPGLARSSREALLSRALEARPDVVAARRQRDRADASLALARRGRIPDVSVTASYAQSGTNNLAISPPTWSVGLSLPLPIFYRQQGEIRKADADRLTQEVVLARAESAVVSDVESAWASFESSRALVLRMEGGLLERSKRAFDLVSIQYQKGAASLLELLDAQRTFISTRLEYLNDLGGYWQAVFRLEQATGVTLR